MNEFRRLSDERRQYDADERPREHDHQRGEQDDAHAARDASLTEPGNERIESHC